MNSKEMVKSLILTAINVRENAYAPYSHFKVGAALLSKDGQIFTGCNIENAAFTPTNCAERTAVFKAVSEGITSFTCIAVVGAPEGKPLTFTTPCGVCRQVLREFCDPKTFEIIVATSEDEYKVYKLEELLPDSFGPENLS